MPQAWDLGGIWGQNFRMGICDDAPSTARSSYVLALHLTLNVLVIVLNEINSESFTSIELHNAYDFSCYGIFQSKASSLLSPPNLSCPNKGIILYILF